ncbi:filamentous hemagglutinin N-terminal domain-containing protein [Leptothoe sp. EHU-05/26/07-4]
MFPNWQGWKKSAGLISATLVTHIVCQIALPNTVVAQIIPDPSLGSDSSEFNATRNRIQGGAVRNDTLLFHSFQEFNVPENERIQFSVDDDIESIFTRVTGSNRSEILGEIRIRNDGDANLFLINPNGVFIGPDAELDIEGSFVATTADGIEFGDFTFSAADGGNALPDGNLLVIRPSALLFNALPEPITVQSDLKLKNEMQLQLVGGDITLERLGRGDIELRTRGGIIEVLALDAPGRVSFVDGRLDVPDNISRANITLDDAEINVEGRGDGDINLYGDRITLQDSTLKAGLRGNRGTVDRQVGDIVVDATESISATESTIRSNIDSGTEGVRGNIRLHSDGDIRLLLTEINTEVKGTEITLPDESADVGSITLTALGDLIVDTSRIGSSINKIGSSTREGENPSGSVTVNAASLLMRTADGTSTSDQARISTSTNGNGDGGVVTINVGRLTMIGPGRSGSSGISSSSSSRATGDAGSVLITVTGPMLMTQRGKIETVIQGRSLLPRRGGNVVIRAESLRVLDNSAISARNTTVGEAGNIVITLDQALEVSGSSSINAFTRRFRDPDAAPDDIGGSIEINADTVSLSQQGKIEVSTEGENTAGRIDITANTVNISDQYILGETRTPSSGLFSRSLPTATGAGGDIIVTADLLRVQGNAVINTSTESDLRGGDIDITANRVQLLDGGQLVASTFDDGEAGSIEVTGLEQILIEGEDPSFGQQVDNAERLFGEGDIDNIRDAINREGANGLALNDSDNPAPSGIFTVTEGSGNAGSVILREASDRTLNILMRDRAAISARALNQGDAGDITVDISGDLSVANSDIRTDAVESAGGFIDIGAGRLLIMDGATIGAQTSGPGDAGGIIIDIVGPLEISDSNIRTDAAEAAGGSINIGAGTVLMTGNGDIRTNVASGAGNGGNIVVVAEVLIALDDSDILAFAQDGAGGNITLPIFFGQNFVPSPSGDSPNNLDLNGRVDVNASGQLSSGVITFPDVSFIENSLTELPDTLIDTESLVATSCIAQVAQSGGSLVVTGADGIPLQPGNRGIATIQTNTVRTLSNSSMAASVEAESQMLGAPIAEPQAVYQLSDGRLVLSKDCEG